MYGAYKPPAGPTSTAAKRIRKEIADLAHENLGAIKLAPDESNVFQWHATLPGPPGSPYDGGQFEVEITVPADYPFSPPHLMFRTRVYHCNINSNGGICLDLLKNAWSPALSLYKVILSLSSLLTDPNPADPLVPDIAVMYKRNRKKHDETAREWTKLYATPKTPVAAPAVPPAPPAAAPVAAASSSRATRTRPTRAVPDPSSPLRTVAGVRRPHAATNGGGGSSTAPIELEDSDDDGGVVGRGEGSTSEAAGASRNGTATARRPKRRRGGDEEEVIVVD